MARSRHRGLDALSAASSLGALPLFGLYNVIGQLVVVPFLLLLPGLQWLWNAPDPVVTWMTVLLLVVAANATLAVAGWTRVTPGRYRASILLLSCFDLAFLLAPGLAKWGAFWGKGTQDLTFGPLPECDCAIGNPTVNQLAGVWIELQFILSVVAVVIAATALARAYFTAPVSSPPP